MKGSKSPGFRGVDVRQTAVSPRPKSGDTLQMQYRTKRTLLGDSNALRKMRGGTMAQKRYEAEQDPDQSTRHGESRQR